MAGGEGVRGLGRHHFGQALCKEDGTGDLPLEWKAQTGGQRHRPLTLLWTDGKTLIPCDFRVYDKPIGGQSKTSTFRRC